MEHGPRQGGKKTSMGLKETGGGLSINLRTKREREGGEVGTGYGK